MRTFHITWLAFFVCFFGWFGLAPLMPAIREDLGLTKPQIGNIIIAAVSATIFARLLVGKLCDTWGPRKTYTALLVLGSLPVMLVGLAHDYTSFLLFRLAIGTIGASFVITQFHTSTMFAPKIKGTVNALTGGWGNLGGGVTQLAMPVIMALIVGFGYTKPEAWRLAMIVPGLLMLIMAFLYYRYTTDTPQGNYDEIGTKRHRAKRWASGKLVPTCAYGHWRWLMPAASVWKLPSMAWLRCTFSTTSRWNRPKRVSGPCCSGA